MMRWGSVRMKGKLTKKLGCLCCVAFNGKKLNKYSKVTEQNEIEYGVNELYSDENVNYVSDAVLKSLFPKADTIYHIYDHMLNKHFYEVNGQIGAYRDTVSYLLSYQYFTGASYSDIDELSKKACEDGALHGDMYWFLP